MTGVMLALAGALGSGGGAPAALALASNNNLAYGVADAGGNVACNPVIVLTPSGGTPPYTFVSWALVSGPVFTVSFGGGSAPWSTAFSTTGTALKQSTYRATVRDATGATATKDVDVLANPFT